MTCGVACELRSGALGGRLRRLAGLAAGLLIALGLTASPVLATATTTTMTPTAPSTTAYGESVTLQATVTAPGASPTGDVTFRRNGGAVDIGTASLLVGGAVKQVAGGNEHSCALTIAGKVRCWGENILGALGDGTTAPALMNL